MFGPRNILSQLGSNPESLAQEASALTSVLPRSSMLVIGNLSSYLICAEWTLLHYLFGPVYYQYKECLVSLYYKHFFIAIPVLNANSVDPDKIPHSEASDLGLHCQRPFYWRLGINGLKLFFVIFIYSFRSPCDMFFVVVFFCNIYVGTENSHNLHIPSVP